MDVSTDTIKHCNHLINYENFDSIINKNNKSIEEYFQNVITNGFEVNLFELFDNCLSDSLKANNDKKYIILTRILSLCSQFNKLCPKSDIKAISDKKSEEINGFVEKYFENPESFEMGFKCLTEFRSTYGIGNKIITDLYNSCVNTFIKNCVKTSLNSFSTEVTNSSTIIGVNQWVVAKSPARIDIQGGWSDLPPICYEMGGSVINIAVKVNDRKPIGAKARRVEMCSQRLICVKEYDLNKQLRLDLTLNTIQEFFNFCDPDSSGALIKSALICCQIIDIKKNETLFKQLENNLKSGLEIELWSDLPQGSGLGTSSLLLGCVIAVLWTLNGKTFSKISLINAVLYSEQLLTTGGGWQDQVGGIIPGLKVGFSLNSLPLKVDYKTIEMNESFQGKFEKHLMLIYSGTVRLAKNLVQRVIQNWYIRDNQITDCFNQLLTNTTKCLNAFIEEDLETIGKLLSEYREQKKVLAPNSEPKEVTLFFQKIHAFIYGGSLCGAGGGGFLCLIIKDVKFKNEIISSVNQYLLQSQIYDCVIDGKGFELSVNEIDCNF